ncbi:MAG: helix-turn-helix transcriptional regulator [Oscillospiraceae bacterium]|nr:helix-turn-helix transcriptional regulator [Oscillospiraceae bacterium]MCL2279778.1 helix-turn-helix transcriptional regulator [Oscillospiraceae bacterium]
MDLEKYKAQVGRFIKKTRKSKKMSQMKLITDERGFQIVSEKTLIEIEKGRKTPRPDTLDLLLSRLGKSMLDILADFEDDDLLHFENRVQEIRSLLNAKKYEQANSCYKQLESEDWYDRGNPKISQALLYLKAIIYGDLHRDPDLSLDTLLQSLEQTRPLALRSIAGQSPLDETYIRATVFSKREYLILVNISVCYADKNELEAAIRICNLIIASITSGSVEIDMREYILNHAYFIFAVTLLELGRYNESLEASNQGIELCEKNQTVQNLGCLYFHKGLALYCLGYIVAAFSCFTQSQMVYKVLHQDENVKFNKSYAKEVFGIEIYGKL